ncbi:MAG: GNAT family N-acetyltransferase [Phycisphaeraceae bacterium]|nr:GNAT family N-acetyltransferase [Phycisphaeraceae bacterium]
MPPTPTPGTPTPDFPSITVRPAVEADAPLILALVRELADYEQGLDQVEATEALIRGALFAPGSTTHALIGEIDGRPQGCAVYFYNFSTWVGRQGIYLEDLFVRPAARGHGLGKTLLAHLAAIAQAKGCKRIDWMVLNWNTPAHGFYRTLGAAPLDGWTVWRLPEAGIASLAAGVARA